MTLAFGVTWSTETTRLTTAFDFDRESAITQTSDRRIWVVWPRNVYGNDTIFCKTSSDFGETWSLGRNLTSLDDSSRKASPSIFQAQNGSIWLIWASDKSPPSPPPPPDPHFTLEADPSSLSIAQGNSDTSTIAVTSVAGFSEAVDLWVALEPMGVTTNLVPDQVTPPPNATVYSTLTVTANGTATPGNYTLTVVGKSVSYSNNVNIALEITESSVSSSSLRTSSDFPASPSASDGDGDTSDYEIICKISNDNGSSWSDEIWLTNNTSNDKAPSLMQAQNGTIWLVWSSERTGNPDVFYKTSTDGGASWSNGIQLTTDLANDRTPSVIQAKDGRIWIVWSSDRFGDADIFYNIYASSWLGETRLLTDTYVDSSPAILQEKSGKIWIFHDKRSGSTSGTGDIYYLYSKDNGATWSGDTQFTTYTGEDLWPTTTQSNDLKIWIAWTSERPDQINYDIYYKTSLVGDVNGDGIVAIMDLAILSQAYGATAGHPNWDIDYDLNGDGIIDIRDMSIIGRNYGATA